MKNSKTIAAAIVMAAGMVMIGYALLYKYVKPTNGYITIDNSRINAINKTVENINAGGCGYFALKLYNRLDTQDYSLMNVGHFKHIVILQKETGLYIDSEGSHTKLSLQLAYPGADLCPITETELRRKVYDLSFWNKTFNKVDTICINQYIHDL